MNIGEIFKKAKNFFQPQNINLFSGKISEADAAAHLNLNQPILDFGGEALLAAADKEARKNGKNNWHEE